MVTNVVKDDIVNLKNKLENIETHLEGQLKGLDEREKIWKQMEDQVTLLNANQVDTITLNIGGKKYRTRLETLLSVKDTLFHKAITSNKFNLTEELFFDRDHKMFPHILDYLRYNTINYSQFNKNELTQLYLEADYYEIGEMVKYLADSRKQISYKNFTFSGAYMSGMKVAGTNIIEDLTERSSNTGIVCKAPGLITIELNDEWEFEEIEVCGYSGQTNIFSASNGANAKIQTSKTGENWVDVGTLPATHNQNIQIIKLRSSSGRYIRFQSSNCIGIGFLNIFKKPNKIVF
jgi:hypothetical protein